MMKIGLIFPDKDRRYKTIHLGLGYIVSYSLAMHNDVEFTLLDTRVATRNETRRFFSSGFDLVGITVFSPVYDEVNRLLHQIRQTWPGIPVCLGGPYVTTMMEEIFDDTPADFAIFGEGEITFSELISHLKNNTALNGIHGLMYRSKEGRVIANPPRDKIIDLDSLPFPAWDIFPMKRYPLHRVVASRGCPYACAWCNSSSVWDQTYRRRNASEVVREIELLLITYGKKIFVFGDNTFNIDLGWLEEFCDLLINRKISILWSASVRADNMNESMARRMKEAGCYNVAVGVESGNSRVLEQMNKKTDLEKIRKGIGFLKKAGIEVLAQYVIGSPGDTLETVRESIAFAKESEADYSNFYTVLPFKRTAQWSYIQEHGRFLARHTHEFHTIKPRIVFETDEFPYHDRLEAIRLVTREGFYSNKDKKSWLFDLAKETARVLQKLLPAGLGEQMYMILKSVYKLKLVKKNNI